MSTLLRAILDDAPRLEGALCRGQAPAWDGHDPDGIDRAIALCLHACPALALCRTWYDRLPPAQRPSGVVAGVIHPRPHARKHDPASRSSNAAAVSGLAALCP